jgi:membrane protein implicated in regulation of membrane protease activity
LKQETVPGAAALFGSGRIGQPWAMTTRARLGGGSVFARYLFFQIPEWGLVALFLMAVHHWSDAPGWLLALGGVVFVAKDLLMYPWLRHAYEKVGGDPGEHLVGRRGTALEGIDPEGWVRVGAELWRAESAGPPIPAGARVRVHALRGHVLVVEPEG